MLLYTKRALPKIPKKRSRAGCDFCRVKKKKCDEGRPVCARCKEADQECVYGPPRPRQRRTAAQIEAESALAESASTSSNLVVRQNGVAEPSLSPPTPILDNRCLGAIVGDANELAELADNDLTTSTAADTRGVAGLDTRAPHASALTEWSSASTTHRPRRHAGAFYATPHLELNMPLFSEFTTIKGRRGLLDHFARVLSRLIVLREDAEGGNPFQRLVLPMSRRSPAVASAIYALSSAHLEFRGAGGAAADVGGSSWTSIEFHSEAARNLAGLIEKGAEGNQNELLAAVILLIYYEVLVHRERSQIVDGHLKGALAILNSGPATSDPTRAFLERAFRFYDVIAALSFRTPTLSPAPAPGGMGHLLPFDSRGTPQPAGSADTLLGMATSLWPIVHRLSNLGALKDRVLDAASIGNSDRAAQLRAELDAEAAAIEAALVAWEPERLSSPDQDANTTTAVTTTTTTGPLRGIFSNARAYRHSSLVHLYRSIRGLRREDATVQRHMRASLACCVEAVESAGPMGALLWPLFVAACEARTEEDRALATRAFAGIDKHQGMANIEQSWQIVKEVWRRADVAEAEAEAEAEGGEGGGAEDMGESRMEGGKILGGFGEEDLWRQVYYDELAWDRFDQQRDQLQKQLFRLSTIKSLQDVVQATFAQEARWISPVNIGGWNIVFVFELAASNSRVVLRLPSPHAAHFAEEKTSLETATIKFLSQHTNVSIPTLFSSGQHADLGHYIILEFIENTGLLSRALAQPNEDKEEAPVLNMDMAGCELEAHLYDVAVHLRRLFQPSFPAIGSLAQTPHGEFEVGGRPLTQNMYNMTYLANIPPSVLPAHDKVYHTADDWYIALAEMHMLQLAFQHNDLVKDEDDCRSKYVARHLFLKLARAGNLSTFGFSDDTWSAQSKGSLRGRCKAPSNTGPFHIWCDDFRPANILLHKERGNGSTVIDWEFTYVAPTQFVLDPPWWLLLDVPEMWHSGMEDWAQQYGQCLDIWLRAMKRAEQDSAETPSDYLLSEYMQDSWTTGRFWLNYAARKSWAFDSVFWRYLDERFFGERPHTSDSREQHWRARVELLNRAEKMAMEAFVDRKMKESRDKVLRIWDKQEAQDRKANVLFIHDQCTGHGN